MWRGFLVWDSSAACMRQQPFMRKIMWFDEDLLCICIPPVWRIRMQLLNDLYRWLPNNFSSLKVLKQCKIAVPGHIKTHRCKIPYRQQPARTRHSPDSCEGLRCRNNGHSHFLRIWPSANITQTAKIMAT